MRGLPIWIVSRILMGTSLSFLDVKLGEAQHSHPAFLPANARKSLPALDPGDASAFTL